MKSGLLVLLSLCVFAAAMVPRHRRAVDTESQLGSAQDASDSKTLICAITTPCAWTVYNPISRQEDMKIKNSYCQCSKDMVCQKDEDNVARNHFIHKCRKPIAESES